MANWRKRIGGVFVALALCLTLAPAVPAGEQGAVDLNTATEEELVSLPGIGPSKAKAIVEHRQAKPFRSVEEVMNVRGIGEHTFESLKDKITVAAPAAPASAKN